MSDAGWQELKGARQTGEEVGGLRDDFERRRTRAKSHSSPSSFTEGTIGGAEPD